MPDPTAEDLFAAAWLEHGIQGCVLQREWQFHPARKWRIDFAMIPCDLPVQPVAVEIEGRGRHQSFGGFNADAEKYNALVALGWRLFRFPAHVVSKDPVAVVLELTELICGSVPDESILR